jgi:hypothetical protein
MSLFPYPFIAEVRVHSAAKCMFFSVTKAEFSSSRPCITAYNKVVLTTGGTALTVPYVLLFVITASRSSAALACSAANSRVTTPLRSEEQNHISTFIIYAISTKYHSIFPCLKKIPFCFLRTNSAKCASSLHREIIILVST